MTKLFVFLFSVLAMQIAASSPKYQPYPAEKPKGEGAYLQFAKKIDGNEINTIFEIGSRDAKDAIDLSNLYQCHVYAFECNPAAIELCKKTISSNPNVTLVPMGIWDEAGEMKFYHVVDGNIGASSFFQFNPKAKNYPDIVKEGLVQEAITVTTTRLDQYLKANDVSNIDLLCMDVQGAAYQVLKSLGSQLRKVKYIIVELETHPIYEGEMLYKDVDKFLAKNGFVRKSKPLDKGGLFGDVLYENVLPY